MAAFSTSSEIETKPVEKLRLRQPHTIIQRMMEKPPKPDQYGYVARDTRPHVRLNVSSQQRKTALVVLDRMIKALERSEFHVEVANDGCLFASRNHDQSPLSIEESYRRVEHEPTAKELKDQERFPGFNRIPKWDSVPTGELTLTPGGRVDASCDAAIDLLVVKAVAEISERIASVRDRRLAEEKRRNEEWRRERERLAEQDRVKAFHASAGSLHTYRLLLDYIEEVRRFGRVPENQHREGQSLEDWLRWAEQHARQVHPLG